MTDHSFRAAESTVGTDLLVFQRSDDKVVQAVAITDADGAFCGGESNPLVVAALDFSHYELHEGDSFVASYLVSSLASGANHDHRLVTPDTAKWGHHVLEVIATGEAEIYIYEGASLSGGTALAAVNRNRNSTNTAGLTITHTPTVTTTGTAIWLGLVGSGNKAGGGERAVTEFILKQATTYLVRVTSRTAANKIVVRHDWYEHTFGDD